ncbi:unnamed protein product [Rodentolepis nana]|uniref:Uncharacterized protein n=1 Tax=Rodentolepis nana TaxID=102285 RepID=A0A0R3T2G7_RODNA|nr:unnamed protein product [Rodentolepis nana]
MPNFHFPLFRSRRRPNEAKTLIALYERQRRQQMTVNYDFYLFGDEPLMTQVIGVTSYSENRIRIDSAPANHQKLDHELVRSTSPSFAINNERCAITESPAEQQKTSYQLDDNFLQTIDEWQRRNVSALEREQGSNDGEESDDEYETPGEMSPVKSKANSSTEASPGAERKVSRTLLDIAAQERLAGLMNSEKDSGKSLINPLPLSLQRKSIIARTIRRDRTKPKNAFSPQPDALIDSSPLTITPGSSVHQSPTSPLPQLSLSDSAFRTPSPPAVSSSQTPASTRMKPEESYESAIASPPWAAAMAAIGASSSPPVVGISKKLAQNSQSL